ncbi:MAG: tryptophan 7-halogenase [Marinibacterium sp.]|nr:tryptophan 7-halogenase [Marinibacterium sp.]
MKIAILGGGTAGVIAATHLSKTMPEADLLHIHDSRLPTIGVGEGTTPRFPAWLAQTTGLGFEDLQQHCLATLKRGTRFEGWGQGASGFANRFHPSDLIGYHFDAGRILDLMRPHIRARRIDARVHRLDSRDDGVTVHLDGGALEHCHYVIDARGFPANANAGRAEDGGDLIRLGWIPTGQAMLRWLPEACQGGLTRAVARPHGWIFMIPLQGRVSSGYLHHPDCSTPAEVAADFDAFLADEGVTTWDDRGLLPFPNFLRRAPFDGRVFRVGNAASFVEPLEATSIGASILQIRAAERWMTQGNCDTPPVCEQVEHYNAGMRSYIIRNSLFIAWHYACGAAWDTPFWRQAARGLERAADHPDAADHLAAMQAFIDAGHHLPGPMLSDYEDAESWQEEIFPLLKLYVPYGNFSELNFAQVGHGIGYYNKGVAA